MFDFQDMYNTLKSTLLSLKYQRDQCGHSGEVARCLSISITELETSMMWLEKAAEESGQEINKHY